MRLKNQVVIVTGGSSGLGRAMSIRFAAEGAEVVIADLSEVPREGGESAIAFIKKNKGKASFVQCDVSSFEDMDSLIANTTERFNRIDVMVNNAMTGKYEPKPLLDTSIDHWEDVLKVNLTGVFMGCKLAIKQMLKQDLRGEVRGRVINMSSQLGIVAAPENCSYGVSKAGVDYLTRSIARDYSKDNIVCNAIAPGKILTGKTGRAIAPDVIEFSKSRTPWPRLGIPDDIAGAALFLASQDASFVQGITLAVDGGWLAS